MLALYGSSATIPVSGLAWRLRTWRRSGRCISVFARYRECSRRKPESGEKITKLGGGAGDAKTPFTERPATFRCGRRHLRPEPCHRAGCLFRRKVAPLRQSTRGDQGSGRKWLGDLRVPFREFTERGVSRRGRIAKGCRRVSASYCSDAYAARGKFDGHLQGFLVGRTRSGAFSLAEAANLGLGHSFTV